MTSRSEPVYYDTPALAPKPSQLIWDALADAEREVLKLRKLLVVKLCDCRRMATTLPLEPVMHAPQCTYRRSLS
jgi:hypothetical protein